MVILKKIRKTGNRFIVIVVLFLLVLFLGSELGRIVPHFFSGKDQIGTLLGKKISYMDYRKVYEEICHNVVSTGKQPTQEAQMRLKNDAWHQLVQDILYTKEINQVGILVGDSELVDLVQGEHIHPSLIAYFKDPQTAAFDKQKLLTFLNTLSKSKSGQEWWSAHEKKITLERAKHKLHQLMVHSCFVTGLEEAQAAQRAGLFCDVDYLHIPFTLVQDDLIPITNQQLRDYMAAHKNDYTASSESRTIQYITFPIQPNEKDISYFQKELSSLVVQFSTTTDPYIFAKQQTDGHLIDTSLSCTADGLPDAFTTIRHTLKEGMVVGPVVNNSFHTLYKLVKQEKGHYEIAVIEKKPIISDHTRNAHFKQVAHLADQVKSLGDLEKLATDGYLSIQKETVVPSDYTIGMHAAARKVIYWLYNRGAVGKVSPLFDLGDAYLLGVMVEQVKVGDLLPLNSVHDKVYQKVLHQEKSKLILNKLKQVDGRTLQGIAEAYGEGIAVQSVDRLRFLDDNIPHLKQAQAFVGKCFGLGLNVISDPIVDETGIFIACVKHRDKEAVTQEKHNQKMQQIEQWMQPYYFLKTMEELAQVKDERYRIE
ncbi:SurA N-terminal domain-containing protein [Candidatus Cardinium hertigii]|uniref:SurA N-terminal domain-containing protein n=1 Tax=Candidatus Cardinium hertigii TaxID=247481 RepID=UPI003D7CEFB1